MSDELKTPWELKDVNVIRNANGLTTVIADTGLAPAIVHRVNCHDKLVEALEGMIEVFVDTGTADEDMATVKLARSALELAKGGTHD